MFNVFKLNRENSYDGRFVILKFEHAINYHKYSVHGFTSSSEAYYLLYSIFKGDALILIRITNENGTRTTPSKDNIERTVRFCSNIEIIFSINVAGPQRGLFKVWGQSYGNQTDQSGFLCKNHKWQITVRSDGPEQDPIEILIIIDRV